MAFTMATMLGLNWIIGYFMLVSDDATFLTVMSWLFTVTNSGQVNTLKIGPYHHGKLGLKVK